MSKIALICIALVVALGGICFGQTGPVNPTVQFAASVVECPPSVPQPGSAVGTDVRGVPIEYQTGKPTQAFLNAIPQGWTFGKAQTYSSIIFEALDNKIEGNDFVCYYGIRTTHPKGLYFVYIKKSIPATQSCTVASGFKFSCKAKVIKK